MRSEAPRAGARLVISLLVLSGAGCEASGDRPGDGRDRIVADVLSVEVTGGPGGYTFAVEIRSPDTGCAQYADWWEVVDERGALVHRRVLGHSHVDEQPFVRSAGPIAIDADAVVWIRAHMNSTGYGGSALRGSVDADFGTAAPPAGFAAELATEPPLPEGCRF